jgi:5'-3' exonuclease
MGVPSFIAWLLKKYQNYIISNNISHKSAFLYIDCNALIHPISQKIVSKNPDTSLDDIIKLITTELIKYLDFLHDYTKADKMFISIDGVAPMSKIYHQRLRRYKSYHENLIREQIKNKYQVKYNNKWSSLNITPGTDFMEYLHVHLEKYYSAKSNVIYSSYHQIGEGEHKIIQHIKLNNINKCIIYSPDADLIFLALATQKQNIYILRPDNDDELIYFAIDTIKECLSTELYGININDFIFLCFLLGNDFIPHLPSIHIHTSGIEKLIEIYVKCSNQCGLLLNDLKINLQFFKQLLIYLQPIEMEYISTQKNVNKKRHQFENLCDIELFNFENLKFNRNHIEISNSDMYYDYYFGFNSLNFKNHLCHMYLNSLFWITDYYFLECSDYLWFYKFPFAPLMSDLIIYLSNNSFVPTLSISQPVNIMTQLLLVIPVQYENLLPQKYQALYTNKKIKHMFPVNITLDYYNNIYLWQSKPFLPLMDLDQVLAITKKITLTGKDKIKDISYM